MFGKSKGIVAHIGFMTFLLITVIIYLFIYFNSPSTAEGIRQGLSGLVKSIRP